MIRKCEGQFLKGVITETEAYLGEKDSASHSSKGLTSRNKPMYGPAGFTYIYFIYGRYHMLNIVTDREDIPSAVLIRAVKPLQGLEKMRKFRDYPAGGLADGPGKLCQAFSIDDSLNRWDLTLGEQLWIERRKGIADNRITKMPRIGIGYAEKKDREALLRFVLKN